MEKKQALLAYVPVIHAGYINLFKQHPADYLFLIDPDLPVRKGTTRKEIRALEPILTKEILLQQGYFQEAWVLSGLMDFDYKQQLEKFNLTVVNDEITRWFMESIGFSEYKTVSPFLRWDSQSVAALNPVNYDCEISESEFDREIMRLAYKEAGLSPDWWRQVGVVVIKDGKILFTSHNTHVPTEQNPYYEGDPRDFVKAGVSSEIATSMHGECDNICKAARIGTSLEGAYWYSTTFCCPLCSKMVALSGAKELFFSTGHASIDGERILKEYGVKITRVI